MATTTKFPLPPDYPERAYAGVLGKLIGVYLGRPVEGWTYERIMGTFGEVDRYLTDPDGAPLVVTDDDIGGTFTFLRALPDHGNDPDITPEQIGQAWLNYIIERRTIIWFGGLGDSTEHTAYYRLKHGVPAPASGSIALNSRTVAEQIGAQIFIDGWGMVAPGDPEKAADLARRAASVSHDGEAIYGAQVVAAMVAQAFVESSLDRLLDTSLQFIPADSIIARVIGDVRQWHREEPDWRATREKIFATYSQDRYGGNCHVVPNHALIILGLLYGEDDFSKSLMIVNTAGFDTDCNSGNLGAILGVKNGLNGIDGSDYDWRGPIADRLYLPTADGGRAITDAVRETFEIVNIGRALAGELPLRPKDGARFHFDLPGAVQGFYPHPQPLSHCDGRGELVAGRGDRGEQSTRDASVTVENVAGQSEKGGRSLAIRWREGGDSPFLVTTPTFTPPEAIAIPFYPLLASPTLYPGQEVRARVTADPANAAPTSVGLALRYYGTADAVQTLTGPTTEIAAGQDTLLTWRIPDLKGSPICDVGLAITTPGHWTAPEPAVGATRASPAAPNQPTPDHLPAATPLSPNGSIYLDWLTWDGAPDVTLGFAEERGTMWRRAWVDGVDRIESRRNVPYRISQDDGTGVFSQGTTDWVDYRVSADVSIVLARHAGIAARVGGMRRWYGLLLGDDGLARLVKYRDTLTTLATHPFPLELDRLYHLELTVQGTQLTGAIDGTPLLTAIDDNAPLLAGGVALIVTQGTLNSGPVRIRRVEEARSREGVGKTARRQDGKMG